MSSQPEEEIEIEEGEIVSDTETEEEEDLFEDQGIEEGIDMAEFMGSLLATPEGDTVCTALVNIGLQLQNQNKILIKILSKLQNA
jgi:hypothetical protein